MRWLDRLADALHALSSRVRRWRHRHEIAEGEAVWARICPHADERKLQ